MERGDRSDFAAVVASNLDWWADAGVDCLVSDAPRDWLKAPAETSVIPAQAGISRRGIAGPSQDPGLRRDGGRDPLPNQLPLFHEWLRASDTLPYAAPAAPRLCPAGDPAAGLMIMTAMPSSEDCAAGALVSGSAGVLFDRMLAAIGRGRDSTYLAGLSCLRPPAGRFDPAGAERCLEIARHHIALAAPRALLLLGDGCARAFFGKGAAEVRGRVHQLDANGRSVPAIVTFAPDFLLTQPGAKALAWADLQLLMEALS